MRGIKTAYVKFHIKGFEVIGISLDSAESKDRVERLIREKALPGRQSFEGQGWMLSMAVKDGVNRIPTTFLIGKDGRVIGVNVSENELETHLIELLDPKS